MHIHMQNPLDALRTKAAVSKLSDSRSLSHLTVFPAPFFPKAARRAAHAGGKSPPPALGGRVKVK